ncbi:MAG TPA: tripartite tricarboxylate transporter permease [candidate division Zixibacteria bacterium]|nr:tripartite tricarboxylate transporter permease [candidate division Zixibacteria bacterium]
MWEAALTALEKFSNPVHLGLLAAGVVSGTVIGILPGLGGIACVAILLPFIYTMDVHSAMVLLVGSLAVVHTSDTITSVLIGTPGSAAAAATVLDGHPLARQGEAARALSAAFLSSLIGGLIGAVFLTLSLPIARPLVLLFGSPELLMLCVLGLSFAGFLTGAEPLKGALAACLGLLLGSVGAAPAEAVYRYTFDQLYLMDGIPLVAVALGVFGVAEVIDLLTKGGQIAERIPLGRGWLQGARDVLEHWGIVVRGALIGVWAGILPGIGATAGSWMSYGHVVAMARDRERFGKGDIRGVIGPESANNSVEAGDFIPTLLFSVPGGAPAAIMLGALFFYGIQPGPRMVQEHLDLIFTIIWSFALANTMGAGLCLFLSPALARLTWIPFRRLAPAVVVTIFFGAFQSSEHFGDIFALLSLGFLGWLMKQLGWPRAPFLVGFVLTKPTEQYLWLSISRYDMDWLWRPGVIALGVLLLLSLAWIARSKGGGEASGEDSSEGVVVLGKVPSILFTSSVLLLFAAALYEARSFPDLGAIFPIAATAPAVLMAAAQLVLEFRATRPPAEPEIRRRTRLAVVYFATLLLFFGAIWLFGFGVATALFTFLFLRFAAGMQWTYGLLYTAAVVGVAELMTWLLNLYWPKGVLLGG